MLVRALCPDTPFTCIPLRISETGNDPAGLLGGRPPRGVSPIEQKQLRYFATVPLAIEPRLDVSIFVADFTQLLPRRGQLNDPGLVWPLVHAPQPRAVASEVASSLTERALLLLGETDDVPLDEDAAAPLEETEEMLLDGLDCHKIGGAPRLVRRTPELVEAVRSILRSDFKLIAQFTFPDDQDALVSGDWPFGDGVFSLFGQEPFGADSWKWYWDL